MKSYLRTAADKTFQIYSHISFILTILVTIVIAITVTNYPYNFYVYIDVSTRDLEIIQFGYILTFGACFPGMAECILDIIASNTSITSFFLYERIEIILSTIIPALGFIIASRIIENDPQYFGMIVLVLLIVQRDLIVPPLLNLLIASKSKIWTVAFGYVNCTLFFLSDAFALLSYCENPYRVVFLFIHWVLFFLLIVYTIPFAFKYMMHLWRKPSWSRIWADEEITILALVIVTKYLIQQLLTFVIFPSTIPAAHYQAANLSMLSTTSLVTAVSVTIITTRLTRTKLTEKIEEHNTFVRYVGHEVRTPLNISGVCTTLMEDLVADKAITLEDKDAQMTHLIEQQKTAFGLAVSILNDLIDYEKLEKDDLALDCSRQNPVDFLLTCTTMFAVQTNEKNINLTLPAASDREAFLEHEVYIDTYKLGKCVRNFISNAFKFTPVGGTIVIAVTKLDPPSPSRSSRFGLGLSMKSLDDSVHSTASQYVRIAVTDSGVGISEENLPKLFNEVVQFDPNRLQEGKGSGLGLFMAKGIADLYKIRLHASSPGLGKGTTIAMDIPVTQRVEKLPQPSLMQKLSQMLTVSTKQNNKVHPLEPCDDEGVGYTAITVKDECKLTDEPSLVPSPVPSLSNKSQGALVLTGHRILVVDDSIPNAKVLGMLFGRKGAVVDMTYNGQECVDKINECITSDCGVNMYHFILMDFFFFN